MRLRLAVARTWRIAIKVASKFSDTAAKLKLLDMARPRIALAEQAKKNERLAVAYETPVRLPRTPAARNTTLNRIAPTRANIARALLSRRCG